MGQSYFGVFLGEFWSPPHLRRVRHPSTTSVLSSASGTSWSFHVRSSWCCCQPGLKHPSKLHLPALDCVCLISHDTIAVPQVLDVLKQFGCLFSFPLLLFYHFHWKHQLQKSSWMLIRLCLHSSFTWLQNSHILDLYKFSKSVNTKYKTVQQGR